ncbi:MAG: VanZ family protein [Micromonosporaceae bacterium]
MFGVDTYQIEQNWISNRGAVLGTLLALPLAVIVVWLVHRRRDRPLRVTVAEVGMVLGTLPWLYLTLRPDPDGPGAVFVVPFRDLYALAAGGVVDLITQLVGNLLVFAALGFFLPVRLATFASVPRVLAVAAVGSLAIEVTQLVAETGRTFSVDDVILNAAGAGMAAVLSRRWWAAERHAGPVAPGEYGV